MPPKDRSTPTPPKENVGIECTKCGCRHFYILRTKPLAGGKISRRRECRHCGRRLTTREEAI